MPPEKKQRLKTMCVFSRDGKTLATKGHDAIKGETFYRVIGGTIEFGEKSEDAVKREVMEELHSEVKNLELVNVTESIFTYVGKLCHDIVFLYKGDLVNEDLYNQEKIHIIEPYGELDAEWISIEDVLSDKIILYPSGIDYGEVFK